MNVKEHVIIKGLCDGDQRAYRYLYDRHYVVLCQFANAWVNDPFLAETIVGDVISHMWEIRNTLNIKISLRAYLMRAVRNRCLNHISSEKERREICQSRIDTDTSFLDTTMQPEEQPLGRLLEQELEDEIIKSILGLGAECRKVFEKSRFEYKNNEEIAAELGISVNTVKYHIKIALNHLRQDLGRYLLLLFSFF
ncbi:MAG: hypothetical protein PARBA_02507 [Parabacteroides sp.]